MSNEKQIESTKYLIEQLKPRLGKTYYAGENITIDENNVISATSAVTDPDHNPYFYDYEGGLVYKGLINANFQTELRASNEGDKFIAYSNDKSSPAFNIPIIISKTMSSVDCTHVEISSTGPVSNFYPGDTNSFVMFNNTKWYYSTNPFNYNYGAKIDGKANFFGGTYSTMAELALAILTRIYSIESYVVRGRPETYTGSATGSQAQAFGPGCTASGYRSTAIGYGSTASGRISTAVGNMATASGEGAIAFGYGSNASGNSSVSFGSTSSGESAFTAANSARCDAKGTASTVQASQRSTTEADGTYSASIATGWSKTNAQYSITAATNNGEALNECSAVVGGTYLRSSNSNQLVTGKYNAAAEGARLIVGCGTNEYTDRKNILEVYDDHVVINGPISYRDSAGNLHTLGE